MVLVVVLGVVVRAVTNFHQLVVIVKLVKTILTLFKPRLLNFELDNLCA